MRYIDEKKVIIFSTSNQKSIAKITESVIYNPAYGEVILKRIPNKTAFLNSHSLQTERTPKLRMTKTIYRFTETGLTMRPYKNTVITTHSKKY